MTEVMVSKEVLQPDLHPMAQPLPLGAVCQLTPF